MIAPPLTYEQARAIAAGSDPARRAALAERPGAFAEVLYFLAGDPSEEVKRAVAANGDAPALGNLVLSGDGSVEVRRVLAAKMLRLGRYCGIAPNQLRARAIADLVIEKLASDTESDIRAAMAELVKDAEDVPLSTVRRLAFDEVLAVAAPVLERSPLLTPEELIGVITLFPEPGRLAAVSRRRLLDHRVAAALIASRDAPTIVGMLESSNASVQEVTLDTLIDGAAEELGLAQQPTFRRDLPPGTVQSLVDRVARQLETLFPAGQRIPEGARSTIQSMVEQRLQQTGDKVRGAAAATFAEDAEERFADALARARALAADWKLDEATLRVSLLTDQDEDLIAGLAERARLPVRTVLLIVAAQSARAMCALARRAGLSAEFAHELQLRLASVAPEAAIAPGPDGAYLLDEEDMDWQLGMFGVERSAPAAHG